MAAKKLEPIMTVQFCKTERDNISSSVASFDDVLEIALREKNLTASLRDTYDKNKLLNMAMAQKGVKKAKILTAEERVKKRQKAIKKILRKTIIKVLGLKRIKNGSKEANP